MSNAGSSWCSKKINPSTIRSRPGKMDLRVCGTSVTWASRSRMARARSSSLEPYYNSGDYQEERPEFNEADAGKSPEQEDRADCDQHQGTHETTCAAAGARTFQVGIVRHGAPLYEVLLIRSIRIQAPNKIRPTGHAFENQSRASKWKFASRNNTPRPISMTAPIGLRPS